MAKKPKIKIITKFSIRAFPSNVEVYYYLEDDNFHQHFDLGILKITKATIKELQKEILDFVNNVNIRITKKLSYQIAQEIKWYI